MQRPHAEHVIDLPAVLGEREHHHKDCSCHGTDHQRSQRVHQVRPRAHSHQPGQRAVVHEARVVLAQHQRRQRAAHHSHQRVHGHQAGELVHGLCAHHIEAEPSHHQHPGAQRQKRDVGRRMCRDGPVLAVAVGARAQQDHGRQGDPPAHGMHDDGARKVVELFARQSFDPGLHPEVLVPGNAFKERIHKPHNDRRGHQLGPELGPLRDPARHNRRNGSRKSEQEEEFDQCVAVLLRQRFRAHKEMRAIGHAVAHHKIHHGGHRKVHQDLDQRIHLVLFANRAQFQKGKPCMHGQHHDGPQKNEQGISALFECFHNVLARLVDLFWCVLSLATRFAPS
ncbi:hypothetical protein D3C71_1045740 [compost metagenome]